VGLLWQTIVGHTGCVCPANGRCITLGITICAAGLDEDVTFVEVNGQINDQITTAWRGESSNAIGVDDIAATEPQKQRRSC
jgi:hypothetical protein